MWLVVATVLGRPSIVKCRGPIVTMRPVHGRKGRERATSSPTDMHHIRNFLALTKTRSTTRLSAFMGSLTSAALATGTLGSYISITRSDRVVGHPIIDLARSNYRETTPR
jgi:hypothetical protein